MSPRVSNGSRSNGKDLYDTETMTTSIRMPGHSTSPGNANSDNYHDFITEPVMPHLEDALDLEYGEYLQEYIRSSSAVKQSSVPSKAYNQGGWSGDSKEDETTTFSSKSPNPAEGWGRRGAAWGLSVAAAFVFLLIGVALAAQGSQSSETVTNQNHNDNKTAMNDVSSVVLDPIPSDLQQICSLSEISKSQSNYRQCKQRCLKATCCRISNPTNDSSCLYTNERLCKEYNSICENLDNAHDPEQQQQQSNNNSTTKQALQVAEEVVLVCSNSPMGDLNRCRELCENKMCCFQQQQQNQENTEENCLHERLEECLEFAACETLLD